MKRLIQILILFIIIFSGCNEDDLEPENSTSNAFRFGEGTEPNWNHPQISYMSIFMRTGLPDDLWFKIDSLPVMHKEDMKHPRFTLYNLNNWIHGTAHYEAEYQNFWPNVIFHIDQNRDNLNETRYFSNRPIEFKSSPGWVTKELNRPFDVYCYWEKVDSARVISEKAYFDYDLIKDCFR